MNSIEKTRQHYLEVARSMGLIPESDQTLEFDFNKKILSHGDITTRYPQIRVLSSGHNAAEVTIWTTVNSADSISEPRTTLLGGSNIVEFCWREDNPDGMAHMSVDLWELEFRFEDVRGAGLFDFQTA